MNMTKNAIDLTFETLHALRNLGPEFFDLKIRLVHQDLQEEKNRHASYVRALTPGHASAKVGS
jgi:hypothetical protein